MNSKNTKYRNSLGIALFLLLVPFVGYGQIADTTLAQLVATLDGNDYEARYAARMELQSQVSNVSAPGMKAERLVVEKQLLAILDENHEDTTRLWILRQIESIGSEASVETLTALLEDSSAHVADAARLALEVNPSHVATDPLMKGLKAATEERQILGFIDSLAERGAAEAVALISSHLSSQSLDIVNTAATALGKIGGKEAKSALVDFQATASGEAKTFAELALIHLSDEFAFLETLVFEAENRAVRFNAFQKCIATSSGKSRVLLSEILAKKKFAGKGDLIQLALESKNLPLQRSVLKDIDSFDTATQAIVLGSLSTGRSSANEKLVLSLISTDDEPLKIQAIEALGRVGSVVSLPILLELLDSRSRDIRETAADAIALLDDSKVDRKLLRAADSGEGNSRLLAVKALGFRASNGTAELMNRLVASDANAALREEALSALELVGNVESVSVLVELVIGESDPKIRRSAQRTLKRMTLRIEDPQSTWAAFEKGLNETEQDSEARFALIEILDSASTPEAISVLEDAWSKNDSGIQKTILRVYSSWRNWDGGFALLKIANTPNAKKELRKQCFDGIGHLILGSDANYSFDRKFDLAAAALASAKSSAERQPILDGFRYSTWREEVYVEQNDVDPGLKEAILAFTED